MIDNGKIENSHPEDLLQRAYDVKSPEDAIDLYRDWAGSYDQHLEGGLRYVAPTVIAQMLSSAEPDHTVRVLDVGCGTGLVGVCLSKLGFSHLDGLDFSFEMLEEARRKDVYRELIQADLNESLDLIQSTYGAAISCGTFTHGHVDASVLGRIALLLEPGAIFACTIHQAVWDEAGFSRTLECLSPENLLEIQEIHERPYFDGSGPDGRFCILRRR
jgi:predicted TPR repeat methyltransferase